MKYYIIAGEASGDLHGSNLMKGLFAEDPSAQVRFWGGPLMSSAHPGGDAPVTDYRDTAVMGYVEVLLKGFTISRNLRRCKADILSWKPDVVILIDYPGFNFKVAKFAHRAGFKVFYYIAPKVWASREGRIRKLRRYVDRLFIVFPFEEAYFKSKGIPYIYKGNPLVDAVDTSPALVESREDFLSRTGLPDKPSIALLAGSRNMEISSMMPVLMEFADRMHSSPEYSDWQFIVAAAPFRREEDYAGYVSGRDYVKLLFGDTYAVLRQSRAAVINSGTASLEAALIGTPQVVGYKLAPASYAIMKSLIKIRYISLANLVIDRLAFRELVQDYLNPANLEFEIRRILEDEGYRRRMLEDYSQVRALLGGTGASRSVAKAMISTLSAPPAAKM